MPQGRSSDWIRRPLPALPRGAVAPGEAVRPRPAGRAHGGRRAAHRRRHRRRADAAVDQRGKRRPRPLRLRGLRARGRRGAGLRRPGALDAGRGSRRRCWRASRAALRLRSMRPNGRSLRAVTWTARAPGPRAGAPAGSPPTRWPRGFWSHIPSCRAPDPGRRAIFRNLRHSLMAERGRRIFRRGSGERPAARTPPRPRPHQRPRQPRCRRRPRPPKYSLPWQRTRASGESQARTLSRFRRGS